MVRKILFVRLAIMSYLLKECHMKYLQAVLQYLFIMICVYFVMFSFEDQFHLQPNNLKKIYKSYLQTCHKTKDQKIQ